MSDGVRVLRGLAERTFVTCVRGLVQAVVALAGIPLFLVCVLCLKSLLVGIGVVLAPMSLLAVRGLAGQQRRWALEWSGVRIVTPTGPGRSRPPTG
jgi:hypothetical protein